MNDELRQAFDRLDAALAEARAALKLELPERLPELSAHLPATAELIPFRQEAATGIADPDRAHRFPAEYPVWHSPHRMRN